MTKNHIFSALAASLFLSSPLAFASDPSPHQILKIIEGSNPVVSCNQDWSNNLMKSALREFDQADYLNAAASAHLAARQLSYCEVHHHVLPFSSAASEVGTFLAFSAISNAKGGITTASTSYDAKYAEILLKSYPGNSGEKYIDDMKKAGLLGAPKLPTASKISTQATPYQLVHEYNSNSVGFQHINAGKTFTVTGKVSKVISMGKGAQVSFDGAPTIKLNDRGFNDYVYCNIPGKYVSQSYSLQHGQTITVRGVYDPKRELLHDMMPIQLLSCQIVH